MGEQKAIQFPEHIFFLFVPMWGGTLTRALSTVTERIRDATADLPYRVEERSDRAIKVIHAHIELRPKILNYVLVATNCETTLPTILPMAGLEEKLADVKSLAFSITVWGKLGRIKFKGKVYDTALFRFNEFIVPEPLEPTIYFTPEISPEIAPVPVKMHTLELQKYGLTIQSQYLLEGCTLITDRFIHDMKALFDAGEGYTVK